MKTYKARIGAKIITELGFENKGSYFEDNNLNMIDCVNMETDIFLIESDIEDFDYYDEFEETYYKKEWLKSIEIFDEEN